MVIEERVSLSPYSTFRIGGDASVFLRARSVDDLKEAERYVADTGNALAVVGGGSNTLFGDDGFDGVVMKIEIPGIDWKDDAYGVVAVVGAGVPWDAFVEASVLRGLYGLENLSGIPGTVGASPVQNIGAYGKEVASVIEWVEVFDRVTKKVRRLDPTACHFGYRDSIWKGTNGTSLGSSLIITRVAFRLSTKGIPMIGYADLERYFSETKKESSLLEVRNAVLAIRSKKFPSLDVLGTAGSFFKNPVLSHEKADLLKQLHPDLPLFPTPTGELKSSAAWLIDRVAGMKGEKEGKARTFEHQALVIVAEDGATAGEVIALAKKVFHAVKEKTHIALEPEVQFVGCSWDV